MTLIADLVVDAVAQQIVANVKQGGFTLHPAIHLAFRRAIVARNECTAWYEENTEGQWENNQSHACKLKFHARGYITEALN